MTFGHLQDRTILTKETFLKKKIKIQIKKKDPFHVSVLNRALK